MPTGNDVSRRRGIWAGILIIVVGVGVGVVCRGPFLGVILSAAVVVPVALLAELLWNQALRGGHLPSRRRSAVLTAIAVTVPAVAVYALFRPPSGAQIVETHLGLGRDDIRDVQTWTETWGIDPMYVVKFRADAANLKATVRLSKLAAMTEPAERLRMLWHPIRALPSWWRPEQLSDASAWSRETDDLVVRLRFDPYAGEAYLLVMYF